MTAQIEHRKLVTSKNGWQIKTQSKMKLFTCSSCGKKTKNISIPEAKIQ